LANRRRWRARIDAIKLADITPAVLQKWKRRVLDRAGDDPMALRSARETVTSHLCRIKSLFGKKVGSTQRQDGSASPLNADNRSGFTPQPTTRNPRSSLCAPSELKSPAVAMVAVRVARTTEKQQPLEASYGVPRDRVNRAELERLPPIVALLIDTCWAVSTTPWPGLQPSPADYNQLSTAFIQSVVLSRRIPVSHRQQLLSKTTVRLDLQG